MHQSKKDLSFEYLSSGGRKLLKINSLIKCTKALKRYILLNEATQIRRLSYYCGNDARIWMRESRNDIDYLLSVCFQTISRHNILT